jgi:hypothetical protein
VVLRAARVDRAFGSIRHQVSPNANTESTLVRRLLRVLVVHRRRHATLIDPLRDHHRQLGPDIRGRSEARVGSSAARQFV